jgi:glycosyltransferase involved in cell wall biosynthesis
MHIAICSERLLFRFGADRVLLLLAKGLKDRGHRVTLIANRFDVEIVRTICDRLVQAPIFEGADHINSNELTANWLHENSGFDLEKRPDLVFIAGWPFFSAITYLRRIGLPAFFIDFGAVPLDGLYDGPLIVQQKLRELRARHLGDASGIIAISDFILRTQSQPDSGGLVQARAVLLGADHADKPLWSQAEVHQGTAGGSALRIVEELLSRGKRALLALGRWEPGCYKNSQEAFVLLRKVRELHPETAMLVLAGPELSVPEDLRDAVHSLGFPDDFELSEVMKRVDAGICTSLWEGFNLPLAEMQWLDRPAFALACGAHPEVVLDPWYLCENMAEMATKVTAHLEGQGLPSHERAKALSRFRDHFQWSRTVDEYEAIVKTCKVDPVRLIIHVNNSAVDPANSGVIRVTRQFCRQVQETANPLFVLWDHAASTYVLPTREEHNQLSKFNGPVLAGSDRLSPDAAPRIRLETCLQQLGAHDPCLLVPETIAAESFNAIRRYARRLGFKLGAIFHDAIPILRPELCNEETRRNHRDYMVEMAKCDFVMPNSRYSADCLLHFWKAHRINETRVEINLLPAEFGGADRGAPGPGTSPQVSILCVSTLEPRKNHRRLIEACLLMQEKYPDLDWTLTLVGNRYAGAFDIADYVEHVAASNPRVRWLGIVDDDTLRRLFAECSFTVYPSIIEGFGMPIVESIWHARPCLCSNQGVMAELARDGGCLTVNVEDVPALSEAITRLVEDQTLRNRLSIEASQRHLKSWRDYVTEFQRILGGARARPPVTGGSAIAHKPVNWVDVLYPGLKVDLWQMEDSERLALTALLARTRPTCAIEVGTYFGVSLSLISRYSKLVFSIDIDPDVPGRVGELPNVNYLIGDSADILPTLLQELSNSGIPVNFVLIDGDHSAEGVRRDISLVLQYVPREPMFLLMHDSFNPGCRKGMLEAPWQDSAYCHFVDLDFVPGRAVENPGPFHGDLWGGLGMAFFLPTRRRGQFHIAQGASTMFERLTRSQPVGLHSAAGSAD